MKNCHRATELECQLVLVVGVQTESVVPVRLELTTLGLLDPRSNQLSYETLLLRVLH